MLHILRKHPFAQLTLSFMTGLFLIATSSTSSAEILTLGADVRYEKTLNKPGEFPGEIENILASNGMLTLIGKDGKDSVASLDMMSRIFINNSRDLKTDPTEMMVLALSGIELVGNVKYNAIYAHPQGFLAHIKTKNGNIALFFKGFTEQKVTKIISSVTNSLDLATDSKSAGIFNLLIPKANAQTYYNENNQEIVESASCGGPVWQISNDSSTSNAEMIKKTWECTKGIGKGAWNSTGGAVVGAFELTKTAAKAVMHPIETFNAASDAVKKIGIVMSDMGKAFGSMKAQYDALPNEVKVKLGCELISTIGVSALISYFTVGAGGPAMAKNISKALDKVLKTTAKNKKRVAELENDMAVYRRAMDDIDHLLADGPEGKKFLAAIKKMEDADNNFNKADFNYQAAVKQFDLDIKSKAAFDQDKARRNLAKLKAEFNEALATRNKVSVENRVLSNNLTYKTTDSSNGPIYSTSAQSRKRTFDGMKKTSLNYWERLLEDSQEYQALMVELEKKVIAKKMTRAQKAAVVAYISSVGCNTHRSVKKALPAQDSSLNQGAQ